MNEMKWNLFWNQTDLTCSYFEAKGTQRTVCSITECLWRCNTELSGIFKYIEIQIKVVEQRGSPLFPIFIPSVKTSFSPTTPNSAQNFGWIPVDPMMHLFTRCTSTCFKCSLGAVAPRQTTKNNTAHYNDESCSWKPRIHLLQEDQCTEKWITVCPTVHLQNEPYLLKGTLAEQKFLRNSLYFSSSSIFCCCQSNAASNRRFH